MHTQEIQTQFNLKESISRKTNAMKEYTAVLPKSNTTHFGSPMPLFNTRMAHVWVKDMSHKRLKAPGLEDQEMNRI